MLYPMCMIEQAGMCRVLQSTGTRENSAELFIDIMHTYSIYASLPFQLNKVRALVNIKVQNSKIKLCS